MTTAIELLERRNAQLLDALEDMARQAAAAAVVLVRRMIGRTIEPASGTPELSRAVGVGLNELLAVNTTARRQLNAEHEVLPHRERYCRAP